MGTELSERIKFKQLDHWQYQYLDTVLELLTGTKKNCKTRPEDKETTNNSWTASPKGDVDRLYVSRKQGGRGLMQLEAAHAVEITKLAEYVDRKEDPLVQVVRTHQHNTDSAVLQTARCLKTEVQKETRKMKDSIAEKTKGRWHEKG